MMGTGAPLRRRASQAPSPGGSAITSGYEEARGICVGGATKCRWTDIPVYWSVVIQIPIYTSQQLSYAAALSWTRYLSLRINEY